LKPEDLVYIDEDAARETIFGSQVNPEIAAAEQAFKLLTNPTSDTTKDQYYRSNK
jgi:hypothetical protein